MDKPFTGRHMLYVMLGFFGVIIAVNILMATLAGTSWTGLLTKNVYVESQKFNGRIAATKAQTAKNWSVALEARAGLLYYWMSDSSGEPVEPLKVMAHLARPTHEGEDRVIVLTKRVDGLYRSEKTVGDGIWTVEMQAVFADGSTDTRNFRLHVEGGAS